jgi:glutamate/tyrosine decarboxylase-like PLP-dependent enzyme
MAETAATRTTLPALGRAPDELWALMEQARADDVDWRGGRVAGYLFLGGEDVLAVAKRAYAEFASENGLSAKAFPSLQRFESDVIAMTAGLFHGEQAVGSITGGGTESILLAVKSARDRARAERSGITAPAIVLPFSGHPAFDKAGHYFGLRVVRTPLRDDLYVDLDAYRAAITENTVLMVGSAPNYPFGMVDPIPEMAALAAERGISFHTDACVGGYFLPFAEKLGRPLPTFDFRVPGVTTMSADLHKFGYTAKGASVILSRDPELFRYQGFESGDWPCGLYRTPNIAGTRPGGAIAAAWAVMLYLGEAGYCRLVETVLRFTDRLIAGIEEIPGLEVRGRPDMGLLSYGSSTLDIHAIAAGLEQRGWFVQQDRRPPGIHLMLSAGHEGIVDQYLEDLAAVAEQVRRGALTSQAREARYS